MKVKLFSYAQLDTFIHRLSGSTKLLFFLIMTTAVMFTYDYRVILVISVLSWVLVAVAKLPFKKLLPLLSYVFVFLIFNLFLNMIVTPYLGCEVYGSKTTLFHAFGIDVTQEQLLYQATKTLKYFSAIPLGFIFILTTNPSEFASSINALKIPYKFCTALSLALRYFPDVQRDFTDISNAQQARGQDNSRKAKLKDRVVNTAKIIIPLVFSTLDRTESISNAMELRGYGKHSKRTWYSYKAWQKADYLVILAALVLFAATLYMRYVVVGSMYYNPFI